MQAGLQASFGTCTHRALIALLLPAPPPQHWDGLRTKQSDRVLVLAATNRPSECLLVV